VDRASVYGDKTGNLNHYIQNTDAKKFVWTANQIDGHPALIGDDVDDYMGCTGLATLLSGTHVPFTLFLVAKFLAGNYQYPFCLGHSTGTGSHWFRTTYLPTWNPLMLDDAANFLSVEGGVPTAGWHYVRYNFDGLLGNVWVDGVQVITNGYLTVGECTYDEATLNSRKYQGVYALAGGSMQYAEDGVYDNVISAPDADLLDSYIAERYPSIGA
jgi:hypothetical protein